MLNPKNGDRDIVLEKNEEERTISVNDKVIEVIPLKHLIKLLTIQASTEQREIVDKVITRQRLNIEYNFVT